MAELDETFRAQHIDCDRQFELLIEFHSGSRMKDNGNIATQ